MKIFSGTAHPKLSEEIVKLLGLLLSQSEVVRFDNSEIRVRIIEDVRDQTCVIIQPTSNPTDTHIMELFFFADALKREGAKKIVGVIPYFGYARQNIQHRKGEDVSAHVIIKILETLRLDEILTIDLHDEATSGISNVPFRNISALPILSDKIKKELGVLPTYFDQFMIASPDQGGVERGRLFGAHFFGTDKFDLAVVEKKRSLEKKHESEAVNLYGNVKNKTVIIVDDIVTSGKTLVNATSLCLEKGAKKVYAAVTHHDFSNTAATDIQNSQINAFYTTNTISMKEGRRCSKLTEISVANIIAEEIKKYG